MRKFKGVPLLFFCVIFSYALPAQQANLPKTFLWRISGNGLTKQSFLYGTMHVQDKRLFHFSDSLYHFLEQTEGYAMEIDPQELIDSVMIKALSEAESDGGSSTNTDYSDKIDSLLNEYQKNKKDKSLRKLLEEIRRKKVKKAMKNQEMPTIMDAYLYGIARRQGKWLGGIEDVQDQLSVFDEFGNNVESEDMLFRDDMLPDLLEQMIGLYLSQDLEGIEEFCIQQYTDDFANKILFQRNKKMAFRMDSLSHIRSMFFAVGAAHLPGDSGVISLLRKKGFQVEPVISAKKIDPFQYVSKLEEIPWVKIEDANKTYEVQMPTKPTDFAMYGDLMKIKLSTDITTLTYYMAGSMVSPQDININKLVDNLNKSSNSVKGSTRKVTVNGLKGIETLLAGSGYYCKAQYLIQGKTMYMLMVGGEKKEMINSEYARKFFNSFVAKEIAAQDWIPKEWTEFSSKEKAFHVQLPGVPKQNKSLEKSADGSNWKFEVHDLIDAKTSAYYIVQVRDLKPTYYLEGDSAFFSLFLATLPEDVKKISKQEITTISTFPAFRFYAEGQDGVLYKMLLVNRGNRVYTVITMGEKSKGSEEAIDKMINSFTIDEYVPSSLKKHTDPLNTFSANVPFAFVPMKSDKGEEFDQDNQHYVSYNSNEAISYEVFKTALSSYYWAKNDSVYFENTGRYYISATDSVLKKQDTYNGKLKGVEWLIQMPGNNNLKKLRQFVSGDTLYTLVSFIPTQYINEERHKEFFESFRVINENPVLTIFENKARKLLDDLQSSDSTILSEARNALIRTEFAKEDKELLEQALIRYYADDTASLYYTTRDRIVDKLSRLADEKTVEFIRTKFETLKGENEHIRFNMLDVLANYKTAESYQTLKNLLLKHTPTINEQGKRLTYRITDSLALTRILYPEILTLSDNAFFADDIIRYSKELMVEDDIGRELLLPFKKNFLYTADTALQTLMKISAEEYPDHKYANIIELLELLQDEECDRQIEKFLQPANLEIKYLVVMSLINRQKNIPSADLSKLAAANGYRAYLFDLLKKNNKESLFPSRFKSQKYMAESAMYVSSIDEDDVPSEVKFIEEKSAVYNGAKRRFYLYKISYSYEDEAGMMATSSYLGIAGGYSTNEKELMIEDASNITGVYYAEEFDTKKVNVYFDAYLQQWEQYTHNN